MSATNVTAAEQAIRRALEDANDEEATSITHAMIANALATLALVEQQRVANLIAMSALNFRDADFTKLWNAEGDAAEWRAIRDQVAEGLGLS